MKFKNSVFTSQKSPSTFITNKVLMTLRNNTGASSENHIRHRNIQIWLWRSLGGGGKWCGRPRQLSRRGGKLGAKLNILNEKFVLQHFTNFKSLSRTQ
jgi:hypothetical protein